MYFKSRKNQIKGFENSVVMRIIRHRGEKKCRNKEVEGLRYGGGYCSEDE